ncbi:MAG: bifunctional [glutamine synthetase] adenylyltransferase/[glutamine synthetase]-adenylyl-L-tyrosine phosphorylase [Mycobacteriales bacterium]
MGGAERRISPQTTLARSGYADAARGEELLAALGLLDGEAVAGAGEVRAALGAAADPDLATLALHRLVDELGGADGRVLLTTLGADTGLRERLTAVLGASTALGDFLIAHPHDWRLLAGEAPVGNLRRRLVRAAAGGLDALRAAYRRELLVLAAHDLTGRLTLDEVAAALADLAAATLDAGLALARGELPAAADVGLAVIGMGKCGGRELNYVSDVDVLFVVATDTELRPATQLASRLIQICGQVAWPVDAGLRPEGKQGPLVRTLASHEAYYQRWAKTWEFQALLKARPVAGDRELGARFVASVAPLVWTAADRPDAVGEVQAMRRRVESTLPAASAGRELKLGPGGLRDVEFAVQLLQLVHGRGDDTLRAPGTLDALEALAAGGYVGRADAASLAAAYRFLRTVEHRLQLQRLRRTHRLPADPAGLRWLARASGYGTEDRFDTEHARQAREVRRLHEKLFYRPLLASVARVPSDELRLSPEAARRRLEVLGFADPAGALRHLEALTAGVARRALIQRALLPAMLHAFDGAADPDAGLLAYRQVSEALGESPWYLRFLRDEGQVAERLAWLLGESRYVAGLLTRAPEALRMLADDAELAPRPGPTLRTAFAAAAERATSAEAAITAVRALRRQELLRVACGDLLGLRDVTDVGRALADIADATLGAAMAAAQLEVGGDVRLAVIGMGRLGGQEMGYGSDADVVFVYDVRHGADEEATTRAAHAVAERTRALLAQPSPDPSLHVDPGLRPEGRQGPLVRSLSAYRRYYERWSATWEAQALLRARPVAGDPEVTARFMELVDPVRYPADGMGAEQVTEIRRIKARVDKERLPRGADPKTHTKLGRGGLADIEWTVQLLQLRHATAVPGLRTPRTLEALAAATAAELIAPADADALAAAWRLVTGVRNALMLVRGTAVDSLPSGGRDVVGVARVLGYPAGVEPGEFLDRYLRVTRRARAAVERVFYA